MSRNCDTFARKTKKFACCRVNSLDDISSSSSLVRSASEGVPSTNNKLWPFIHDGSLIIAEKWGLIGEFNRKIERKMESNEEEAFSDGSHDRV